MTAVADDARSVDLREQEVELQLATHRAGVWLTMLVSIGATIFVVATWDLEDRGVLLALALTALASSLVVSRMPAERIMRGPWREVYFGIWASAESLVIAAAVLFAGGVDSPLVLLFVLPLLFGALAYRLVTTAIVGAIDVVAFLAVAALAGNRASLAIFGAFALVCVAVMSAWGSNSQAGRRRVLAETANALVVSESTSARQARQQAEVASLGARALAGEEIRDLSHAVVAAAQAGIGVEQAAVMKVEDDQQAISDTPLALIGDGSETVLPMGLAHQAGYVLTSGESVIVGGSPDGTNVVSGVGDESATGVAVPIMANNRLYGVLGAQSTQHRAYGAEDVSFMQALANVLGSAVTRMEEEERTRHDALHDPLTGLANRTLFRDRIARALGHAVRHRHKVAVLFLDLDEFKQVNDSLGHGAGDQLLTAIAPRLESAVRATDTLARFGGDEFAILMEEIADADEALGAAERITEALSRPFELDDKHYVSASIGIAVGDGRATPDALLRDSDAALYEAKRQGRGSYQLFGAETRERILAQLQVEGGLRHALERNELELRYQPVIRLSDRSTVGVEALVRWRDPERGLMLPGDFIPVAEEARLIEPIGKWVVETACVQAAEWQEAHPDAPPLGIGVNLSAGQLVTGHAAEVVASAIDLSGLDPTTLRIELTESTLVENWSVAEAEVAALKNLGVSLVLDDFGSGFSSLTYLTRLPLDSVKLDRVFVDGLREGSRQIAVVSSVIDIGEALGFTVVAEGIETDEQLDIVERLGCGYAQGYYFAHPMEARDVGERLERAYGEGSAHAGRFAWDRDPRRKAAYQGDGE